jgi:hypothetical protein
MKGRAKKIENSGQSILIDLYGYTANEAIRPVDKGNELEEVTDLETIVCVPRHNDRFIGVKNLELASFMDHGNREGAVLKLHA